MTVMVVALPLAALLVGCGGGSSSPTPVNTPAPTPQPVFPPVTGSYNVAVTFDAFTVGQASGEGVLQFVQASINQPQLAGDCSVVVTIGGDQFIINTIREASVTEAGAITFKIGNPAAANPWLFNGAVSANGFTMSGTHTLASGSSQPFPGAWAAEKTIGASRSVAELFAKPLFPRFAARSGGTSDLLRSMREISE
jgi:hypothetical protein